ncbi:Sas10 C-terminal domain-containing protein [Schizophyllum commune]
MVRKRATKKNGGKTGKRPSKDDARVANWNTAAEIPMEDEDEFHMSRDQILLEGEDDDDDDLGGGDEVFGLQGLSSDSEADEEDDDQYADMNDDDEDAELSAPSKSTKKSKKDAKVKGKKASAPSSSSSEADSDSEEETWGRGKKAYYASNADEIDSEDEEAREMEEQEARRLQGKALEGMTDADFGLEDDAVAGDVDAGENEDFGVVDTSTVPAIPLATTDPAAILKHLEKTNPEALALARDWEDTAYNLAKAKQKLDKPEGFGERLGLGMMHLYYQTLLTYASTLAFYIHLRATPKYATKPDTLQSHPIFARLLTLKQALATLEELDFAPSDSDEEDELDDGEEDSLVDDDSMDFAGEVLSDSDDDEMLSEGDEEDGLPRRRRVDFAELGELLAEAEEASKGGPFTLNVTSGVVKKGDAKKAKTNGAPDTDKPPKKKRKTADAKSQPVFDLVEPEFEPSSSSAFTKSTPSVTFDLDAHGEPTALQHADAADKRAKKRTLRFYTSRIESKSAKREGARQAAMGGDDDIPYRERRKEKETREAREAAKRALGQGGEDLEAGDAMDVDDFGGADGEGAAQEEDGYYDLVARASKAKKAAKKAAHDAEVAAERELLAGAMDEESAGGPRAPTRAIMANKGLTPKRAKAVRNPRVKKRMRFEKAQRKVASQRAVYKGGLAATGGRYEGEKSGISKVVKSVKLS